MRKVSDDYEMMISFFKEGGWPSLRINRMNFLRSLIPRSSVETHTASLDLKIWNSKHGQSHSRLKIY